LASRFLFLEIDEGSLLIEQGQPVEGLYVLLSGSADVLQSESDGEELLAQLQAGDLLGESALLSGTPAPETVRAATKAYALMMPAADFRKTVMAHPHVLDYVSTVAASKALVSQGLVEPAEQNAQYYDWHLDLL
jgi:CRP-like cAMP-binding protein